MQGAVAADTLKVPVAFSLLVHGALLAVIVFSVTQKTNLQAPPNVLAIQARPVDERLLENLPPRVDPAVQAQRDEERRQAQARQREADERARQEQVAAENRAREERERQEAARVAAETAAAERAAAERAAREKAAAEQAARDKAAREKAAREKAAAEKAAREKAAADKARREREAALAEQRRREAAALERRRQEDQAIMMAAMEEEERRQAAEDSGQLDLYATLIRQKVERNWIRPAGAVSGLSCEVRVRQIPGGDVVDVRMGTCNGDATVIQSIEAAVRKASPLPPPPDPSLFEKELIFRFAPED